MLSKTKLKFLHVFTAREKYRMDLVLLIQLILNSDDLTVPLEQISKKKLATKDKMNAEILAQSTDLFGHDLVKTSDAIEQIKLNRKILAVHG